MRRLGKQDKIPQCVLAIFDGQSVEEILNIKRVNGSQ